MDLSIVKRIALVKKLRFEARMDLFNLFDTINFSARREWSPVGTAFAIR